MLFQKCMCPPTYESKNGAAACGHPAPLVPEDGGGARVRLRDMLSASLLFGRLLQAIYLPRQIMEGMG